MLIRRVVNVVEVQIQMTWCQGQKTSMVADLQLVRIPYKTPLCFKSYLMGVGCPGVALASVIYSHFEPVLNSHSLVNLLLGLFAKFF